MREVRQRHGKYYLDGICSVFQRDKAGKMKHLSFEDIGKMLSLAARIIDGAMTTITMLMILTAAGIFILGLGGSKALYRDERIDGTGDTHGRNCIHRHSRPVC